jgi:drug/metabolite transporter (DMT)-like permease
LIRHIKPAWFVVQIIATVQFVAISVSRIQQSYMRIYTQRSYTKTAFYNVMMFSAFWALQIFVTKLGFNAGAEALPFQILSIITAILILALMILPNSGREFRNLFKQQPRLFWQLFFANGIQSGLGTYLSILGISQTEAINAGFLVKFATVTTILFAWVILNERLTYIKVMMVLTMLSGAYLLTTKGQIIIPRIGDLFIIAACICWSLGNVLIRKYLINKPVSVDIVTFQKPISGLPVILVLVGISIWNPGVFLGTQSANSCCQMSAPVLLYGLGNGFCLAMTWMYLNHTLKTATASYMTMMSMATPVIVSLLAMIFLKETLDWVQVVGGGMIVMSGVVTYFSGIAQT